MTAAEDKPPTLGRARGAELGTRAADAQKKTKQNLKEHGDGMVETAMGAEGKRKLQIGVKKRVDHCPIKSRKRDVLHMHYMEKLEDGMEFDSSLPRNEPFVFSLGTGKVIKGWDQGLLGMCEAEKRKLVIPSELVYGELGAPLKIPGGATLAFEVELLKIE
ncbi:FK506-binding protein 2A [Saguinus oedipus]|uniref:peptidylprolyl isomerase n=1 Tax=Saguinus oedipus TaxID=9490 RepID=A0ABQ9VMQ0_SAGOE|nr:FK506-binding protein 2A [Saguinus oedipus]